MTENYILHTDTNVDGTIEVLHINKDHLRTESTFYYKQNTLYVPNVDTDTLTTRSDFRFKNRIEAIDVNEVDKLMKVETKTYSYKNDKSSKKHYGFIAQDVKGLFPDLVQEDETGFYRINYVEFIPIIIDGFKRLNKKVEDQEKRIEELENKIMTKDMNNGCKDDCE